MKIVSLRDQPDQLARITAYVQSKWATEKTKMVYEDCLTHCVTAAGPLPHWYLLVDAGDIVGCAGLVTNDFISRMDLFPWVCALFIEEARRGNAYGGLLLEKAKDDARKGGFPHLYLCTDHVGYYERFGFRRIGTGWHPWGESSSIYGCDL